MSRRLSTLTLCALLTLAACGPRPADSPAPGFSTNPYCPSGVTLCSALPEQILTPTGCSTADQQCARDFFSWQTFVSLNWPGKIVNAPEGVQIVEPDPTASAGDRGSRVWELWMDPDSVFLPGAVKPSWQPGQEPPTPCNQPGASGRTLAGRLAKATVSFVDLDPDSFFTATVNQPLIDQAMNFVVFEIRMNQGEVGWVVDNSLYQQETVQALTTSLQLPNAAIEAKAAWRILPAEMPEAQKNRYYRQMAKIVLDGSAVEGGGGAPVCLTRELGLIGLHLRHNGLWGTFEQVDNVKASDGITPTLYNPACTTCATNLPPTDKSGKPIPASDYKWSLTGPSASLYQGFPNVPAQITRAPGQDRFINVPLNHFFQSQVLTGTVWANYMLITTNWIELPPVSQPIPALNTSLEPFLPSVSTLPQACIDCHELAVNGNNAALGQSFLPFRACPQTPKPGQSLPANCLLGRVDTLASRR
ncbi:MAG TPA: hypothetical protein VF017_14925 [Thermoanaerobaculia bacterium]|nr:hypothetical protein [Thermoanaerobaculia bacterium]